MIRVFILAGQSNMEGATTTAQVPSGLAVAPQNVRLFEDGAWRNLVWRETFGPELGLSWELASAFSDDQLVLCKVAVGGANLYYDWNPDGVSRGSEDDYRGPQYPKLTSALETLSAQFVASNSLFEFSGMFWMQGERDSVFEFMAESYAANLVAFIAAIRKDTDTALLPFVFGQIAPRIYRTEAGRFEHAFRQVVQEAQRRVSGSVSRVRIVETTDLPQSDNLHFDVGGQIELGRRFARTYLELRD